MLKSNTDKIAIKLIKIVAAEKNDNNKNSDSSHFSDAS